jgi:hypothetical protein
MAHRLGWREDRLPAEVRQRAVNRPQTCRYCQLYGHVIRLGLLPRHEMPMRDAGDQRLVSPSDRKIAALEARLARAAASGPKAKANSAPTPGLEDARFDVGTVHITPVVYRLFAKSRGLPDNMIASDVERSWIYVDLIGPHCRLAWLGDSPDDRLEAAKVRGPLASWSAQARWAIGRGAGTVLSSWPLETGKSWPRVLGTAVCWSELGDQGNRTLVHMSPDDGVQVH